MLSQTIVKVTLYISWKKHLKNWNRMKQNSFISQGICQQNTVYILLLALYIILLWLPRTLRSVRSTYFVPVDLLIQRNTDVGWPTINNILFTRFYLKYYLFSKMCFNLVLVNFLLGEVNCHFILIQMQLYHDTIIIFRPYLN